MNLPTNIDQANLPQTYEAARQALAQCEQIDECKDWADKAAALASYAKQADDPSLMEMALRIQTRATRRVGQLLEQIPVSKTGPKELKAAADPKPIGVNVGMGRKADGDLPQSRSEAAKDAGLSKRQAKTALRVARVPEADFDRQVDGPNPPTVSKLAEQGTQKRQPINLGGRTPKQFNRALHFNEDLELVVETMRKLPPAVTAYLSPRQVAQSSANLREVKSIVQTLEGAISHEQHSNRPSSHSEAA